MVNCRNFRLTFKSKKFNHLFCLKTNFKKYFSFITYRSCKHLDGKHTIFGKVVGGMDTLTAIEQVETDFETDMPKASF